MTIYEISISDNMSYLRYYIFVLFRLETVLSAVTKTTMLCVKHYQLAKN